MSSAPLQQATGRLCRSLVTTQSASKVGRLMTRFFVTQAPGSTLVGQISVNAIWFHEARHDEQDAPLMIWFQGGPGGSSLHGMLYENGPCLSDGVNGTEFNPNSWTEHFNIIYLDQPAGVGFSYVDDYSGETSYPSRAEESALDVISFIKLFYEAFPDFADADLHLAGESYAGRYIPSIASTILEYNDFLTSAPDIKAALATIPLSSLMLGNPWISPAEQLVSMYDVSCFPYRDQFDTHMDPEDCTRALKAVDICEAVARACALGDNDPVLCAQPKKLCQDDFIGIFANVTRSYYDRRLRNCPGPQDCYPDIAKMVDVLNSDKVFRDQLEVPTQTGGRKKGWDMMSPLIERRYFESGDFYTPAIKDLQKILDHSQTSIRSRWQGFVDVLVYVGVADIICNAEGVLEGLKKVRWAGRTLFRASPWHELPWNASKGGRGGRIKNTTGLWLAEIEEAGHM
ncbi:Carboxypeptidase Y-like protein A [Colletotrichum siamense]|nr:Carboxypeptidase Y-like protein A [Colletotrichum siamense]KAF4867949.1 Carboxypeptidase Y-like protein A [Colletotrichum siamense]